MQNLRPRDRFPSAASLILLLAVTAAQAQQSVPTGPAGGVGNITHLSGTLTARRADGSTRFLSVKSQVAEGGTLSTAQGTYAWLKFADGAEVVLRRDSQIKVENFRFEQAKPESDNMLLSLIKGGMRSVTGFLGRRNKDRVQVVAPNATIGIRGTHFGMLLCLNDCGNLPAGARAPPPNGLHVDVVDGAVVITNPAGQQTLAAGQFGYVRDSRTPQVSVPPQRGAQVTMPLAISRNAGNGGTVGRGGDSECAVP